MSSFCSFLLEFIVALLELTLVSLLTFRSAVVLTLSLPEKLKNSIFEMPIIPQTLNTILDNHKCKVYRSV